MRYTGVTDDVNLAIELPKTKVGRMPSMVSPLIGDAGAGAVTFKVEPSGLAAVEPAATLGDTGLWGLCEHAARSRTPGIARPRRASR